MASIDKAPGSSKQNEPVSEEPIFIARTDAKCTDPRLGELLGAYLGDALSAEEKQRFKKHIQDCLSCDVSVCNWFQLRRALQRPLSR